MNQDELHNLLNVMQKKISELTTQNIMLEAKVIYMNSLISKSQPTTQDGGYSDEESTESITPTKSRRSA
jgi:hypothetical protein